jgi:hypothetical protein
MDTWCVVRQVEWRIAEWRIVLTASLASSPPIRSTRNASRITLGLDTPGKLPPDYSTDAHASRITLGLDTPGKLPPDYSTDAHASRIKKETNHA